MILPKGYILVPVSKAILILTEQEYQRGILRGKWLSRQAALRKRTERCKR